MFTFILAALVLFYQFKNSLFPSYHAKWDLAETGLILPGYIVATTPSQNLKWRGCSMDHNSMLVITWRWAGTPTNHSWLLTMSVCWTQASICVLRRIPSARLRPRLSFVWEVSV